MTAPLVTPFGTPWGADTIEDGANAALAHLSRPIRHRTPGTLWERIAESAAIPSYTGGTE